MAGTVNAQLRSGLYPKGSRELWEVLEQDSEWATLQTLSNSEEEQVPGDRLPETKSAVWRSSEPPISEDRQEGRMAIFPEPWKKNCIGQAQVALQTSQFPGTVGFLSRNV